MNDILTNKKGPGSRSLNTKRQRFYKYKKIPLFNESKLQLKQRLTKSVMSNVDKLTQNKESACDYYNATKHSNDSENNEMQSNQGI